MKYTWKHIAGRTGCILTGGCLLLTYNLNAREIVLFDSGDRRNQDMVDGLKADGFSVVAVLQSHLHVDHVQNNELLIGTFGTQIFANEEEIRAITSRDRIAEEWNIRDAREVSKFLDNYNYPIDPLKDAAEFIILGNTPFHIFHLFGHSPGHIGIMTPDNVFYVGDALLSSPVVESARLPYNNNVRMAIHSMNHLRNIEADYYAIAHMEYIERKDLNGLIRQNEMLLEVICEEILEIVDGPVERGDLVEKFLHIYGIHSHWYLQKGAFRHCLRGFIDFLIEEGRLLKIVDGKRVLIENAK